MKLREHMEKLKQKQKGFTLVELIVVIAIIGILAGVMLPKYFGFSDDARKSAALAEAKSIRTVIETYYAENGKLPQVADPSGTPTTTVIRDHAATPNILLTAQGTLTMGTKLGFTFIKSNGSATTKLWQVICTEEGNMQEPTQVTVSSGS